MKVLYGVETLKCVATMSFSGKTLGQYQEYVKNLMLVKIAAAKANVHALAISAEMAEAIIDACELAMADYDERQYPVDVCHGGGGIGINMNINEVIHTLVSEYLGRGVDPISHINCSQSTADVCHTAIRLTLVNLVHRLLDTLSECILVMQDKQREVSGVATIARTCMMDAMQMDMGDRFSGYVALLLRRKLDIESRLNSMLTINLGGTVTGSGEGASPGYREVILETLSEVVGIPLNHPTNFYDAAQNMDELVALSDSLSNLAQALAKVSQDFRFLSSGPEAGIGELRLPKTQAGSSFFPGKVNPVLPEMMMQCAFMVRGLARTIESAHVQGDTDLNVFEEFAGVMVMDQANLLDRAIRQFTQHTLMGLAADRDRCTQHALSLVPLVTRLSSEHGYQAVSDVLLRANVEGQPMKQLLMDTFDVKIERE